VGSVEKVYVEPDGAVHQAVSLCAGFTASLRSVPAHLLDFGAKSPATQLKQAAFWFAIRTISEPETFSR
jgi:hypothetical protein